MATALLFANTDWYLFNFRLPLAHELQERGFKVLLVSPPGPYAEHLRHEGFTWYEAPMHRRSLNPWREMRLILWLYRLMQKERVTVFHGFTLKSVIYGSIAARWVGEIRRINSIDGLGYVFTSDQWRAKLLKPLVSGLLRLALSGADSKVVLLNRDDIALFKQSSWVRDDQIVWIPGTGVDCERFQPPCTDASVTEESRTIRVLLSCRLLWDKGIKEFVAASEQLKNQGLDVEFWLAGAPDPGNPASVPEHQLARWEKAGLVHLLGHVSDMPDLYRQVDIVALPSYREGLPTGLVEAGACGLPVVATDVPGCRDVVENGQTGLLVPPQNAEALADALNALAQQPQLRSTLGQAARARVLQLFEKALIIRQTLTLYSTMRDAEFKN